MQDDVAISKGSSYQNNRFSIYLVSFECVSRGGFETKQRLRRRVTARSSSLCCVRQSHVSGGYHCNHSTHFSTNDPLLHVLRLPRTPRAQPYPPAPRVHRLHIPEPSRSTNSTVRQRTPHLRSISSYIHRTGNPLPRARCSTIMLGHICSATPSSRALDAPRQGDKNWFRSSVSSSSCIARRHTMPPTKRSTQEVRCYRL